MDEKARLEIIKSLSFVHRAALGDRIRKWNDIYKILLRYRPDIIAFGYDQKVDMDYLYRFLRENGLKARVVRLRPFKSGAFKSSRLKKLMKLY